MQKYLVNRKFAAIGSLVMAASLAACGGSNNSSGSSKCSGLNEGDFIITEFLANPAGTDDYKEYIEIFNPGTEPLTLKGVKLFTSKDDGSSEKSKWTIKDAVIEPGQYFVVGDFLAETDKETGVTTEPYQHLDYAFSTKLGLGNSNSIIGFRCGSTVVDKVVYASSSEARAQILSGDKFNDSGNAANWCAIPKESEYEIPEIASYTYNEDGSVKSVKPNYGTPGKANPAITCDYTPPPTCEFGPGQCCDGETARNIVLPEAGQLIINEILAYAGDDVEQEGGGTKLTANKNYHYVELYAKSAFDLNGLKLSKSDTAKWAIESSACIHVNPNDFVVVAKNGDKAANGGVNADVVLSKLDMNQSGTLSILKTVGEGESAQEEVIDSVEYPKTTANTSYQRSNDFSNNFCESTGNYGTGFHGTPGAANGACAPGPVKCETLADGQCCDNGTPRTIRAPAAEDFVITEIMAYTVDAPGENGNETDKDKSNKNYQFIEILSDEGFDLNGLTISKNATTGNWKIETDQCVSVPGNSYFVIAKNGDTSANGGIDADFVFSKLDMNQNGTIQFIADRGGANETVIAEATYIKTAANTSWQLSSDESGEYCESTEEYGEKFHGTPGNENSACPDPNSCLDNGTPRSVVPASVGDLVITELMTNPVGANAAEKKPAKWFEVKANKALDMNGVVMKRGNYSETISSDNCLKVSAGGYFVVAFSDDTSQNGGLPANVIGYVQSKIDLTYGGSDTLYLEDADGGSLASFTYPKWNAADNVGHAIQIDGSNYCAATAAYGSAGNYGTPGAENGTCEQ